jgi:hypothetical protein
MYSDQELLDLWAQDEQPIPFARAVLAGEKAPVAVDLPWGDEIGLKRLMALTDASVADGYGHGVGGKGWWHNVINWKGPRGVERLSGNFGTVDKRFVVDVTELAREWQQAPWDHFGIALTTGNLEVLFHSRQAVDPLLRPKLVINDTVEVPCVADAGVEHRQGAKQGAPMGPTVKVSNTVDAMFRFADIHSLPIERAVLVLHVSKTYDAVGQWRLLELVPPCELNPPHIADIFGQEGNYFESEQCGADPTVSPYEQFLWNTIIKEPNQYGKATAEEENGEKFVRCYWNNRKQTNSWSIPIYKGHILGDSNPIEGRRVHLSYKIRMADNFARAVQQNGKFPGFCSAGKEATVIRNPWPGSPHRGNKTGILWAGNGGGKVHGYDGWSARGGYMKGIRGAEHPAEGCTVLSTYAYFLRKGNVLYHEAFKRYEEANGLQPGASYLPPDGAIASLLQPGESLYPGLTGTGCGWEWDSGAPGAILWPNRWHRVDQIIRVNDPLETNGELDAYIDGRQIGRIRDVKWRSHEPKWPKDSTLGVANCWFNFYQGGTGAYKLMTEETHWDVKHIAVKVLEWDE